MEEIFKEILEIRELQDSSKKTYLSCFYLFDKYCLSIGKAIEKIDRKDILTYISSIKSESTRIQTISIIKIIYRCCIFKPDNISNLPKVKKHWHVVDYLTTKEVNDIVNSVTNLKHRLMLKIQYSLALRVSELCEIKKTDFIKNWNGNIQNYVYDLRIKGKGGETHLIPVSTELIAEIKTVYLSYSAKEKQSEYLFRGQFKESYSPRSVQIIMNKALNRLGISKTGNHSTHLLRISRGTHLILAGIDISFVQKLLRHRKIETTQKYYNGVNQNDLRVVFTKADTFLKESLISEILLTEKQKIIA